MTWLILTLALSLLGNFFLYQHCQDLQRTLDVRREADALEFDKAFRKIVKKQ
jgi:hypothetical protein